MKRGISLISVLMFMMAATTASIVLFRWIGEENFASGSRLKSSEAYQASEAGLDAAYSWLSFKAADVGALLSDYLSNNQASTRSPRLLNSVLGGQTLGNQNVGERFDVYLLGADTVSKPYKLKILSVGKGRDNSQVSQTAIFKVDGLYTLRTSLSTSTSIQSDVDFNDAFWGNLGTVGFLEVSSAVMTQTAKQKNAGGQGLNTIKITGKDEEPGYLILDGNFYVNNGISIYGDLYSTGTFDLCSGISDFITGDVYIGEEFHPTITSNRTLSIGGSAYFNGKINPNVANPSGGCQGSLGGTVQIDNNTTIMDAYEYYINGNPDYRIIFDIKGSLVMDSISYIDLGRSNSSTSRFEVQKNVAIKNFNPTAPNLNYNSNSGLWPLFGKETTSNLCVPSVQLTTEASSCDDCDLYRDSPGFYFKTKASNTNVKESWPCTPDIEIFNWGADPMDGTKTEKNYKSKLSDDPDVESCENTPIVFDQTIYEEVKKDNPANWVHRLDKPGSCAKGDNSWMGANANNQMYLAIPSVWVGLGTELQNCWNAIQNAGTQDTELYNGEWLVVYIKDKGFFNVGNALTTGKYIIINEISNPSNDLPLPPTSAEAQVMLYLPLGYSYKIKLDGTQIDPGYNYFIFSDGNIGEFTTDAGKLHGNVFMNNCAVMNTNASNPTFYAESNTEFLQDLINRGIIQSNPEYGSQNNPKDPLSEAITVNDNQVIPIGNRLKVELESKSISRERINNAVTTAAEGSILVMPRIIFLPKDALSADVKLSDYYTFLYLNGATPFTRDNQPAATCREKNGETLNQSGAAADGVYTCSFTSSIISDFYVQISGDSKTPMVSLYADKNTLEYTATNGEDCARVSISLENGANNTNISYSVGVSYEPPSPTGWRITPSSVVENGIAEIQSSKSSELIYTVCLTSDASNVNDDILVNFSGDCDGCTINTNKQSVLISKKKTKSYVYRQDIEPDNIIDCPADIGWKLESSNNNDCKEIATISPYKNTWECDIGSTVTLNHPQENEQSSCELSPQWTTNPNFTVLESDASNVFEASYKLKRYILYVNKPAGSVVNFTASNPHGGTVTEKCENTCASVILYHGLKYTIEITGVPVKNVEHSANNLTKISSNQYTIEVNTNENLLRIEQGDMAICEFESDGNICPGIVDLKRVNVKKDLAATTTENSCYFFSYIFGKADITGSGAGNILVNGVPVYSGDTLPPPNENLTDGGYYVYVPSGFVFSAGTYANVDLSESCQIIRDCETDCGDGGGSVSSSSAASSSNSSGGISGAYKGDDFRSSMTSNTIVPRGISVTDVCFDVITTIPASFGENRSTFIISCNAITSTPVSSIDFTMGYSEKCYKYSFSNGESVLNTFNNMNIIINTSAPIGVGETLRAGNVCIRSSKEIRNDNNDTIACELLNSTTYSAPTTNGNGSEVSGGEDSCSW